MGKKLSEMSLKELWQLFPIVLTEYQASWKEWYSEEEQILKQAIPQAVRISHIGSTAIGSIWAKPPACRIHHKAFHFTDRKLEGKK